MRESLRIAMPAFGFFPNLGGAEIGLHNVAKRLKQRGHEPVVISSWKHVRALERLGISMPYQVKAYPPRCLGGYKDSPQLYQQALNFFYGHMQRKYKFDVAHINYAFPTGVSFVRWQETRKKKLPFLIQCVGEDIQKQPEINYGMRLDPRVDEYVQTWLPKVPMVTAVSDSVRNNFLDIGIEDNRIRLVPYGVDVQRFSMHKPDVSRQELFGCGAETFIFLCVGRYHPKKNFEQALRAFAALRQQDYDCIFVCVGNGNDALLPLSRALGVESRVILRKPPAMEPGNYDEIPAKGLLNYYHHADCFLMPSITETFGIVIAEAMASGLPVIASDAPGCRDVTDYGAYALSYNLADDDALASHMKTMLTQNDIRAKYRELSRARAPVFDWESVTDKYQACYNELLSRDM